MDLVLVSAFLAFGNSVLMKEIFSLTCLLCAVFFSKWELSARLAFSFHNNHSVYEQEEWFDE